MMLRLRRPQGASFASQPAAQPVMPVLYPPYQLILRCLKALLHSLRSPCCWTSSDHIGTHRMLLPFLWIPRVSAVPRNMLHASCYACAQPASPPAARAASSPQDQFRPNSAYMLFYERDPQPDPSLRRAQGGGRSSGDPAGTTSGSGAANRSSNGSTSEMAEGGEEGNKQHVQQTQQVQQHQEEEGEQAVSDGIGAVDMDTGPPSDAAGQAMDRGGGADGGMGNQPADGGGFVLTSYRLPEPIHQQLWADNLRSVGTVRWLGNVHHRREH